MTAVRQKRQIRRQRDTWFPMAIQGMSFQLYPTSGQGSWRLPVGAEYPEGHVHQGNRHGGISRKMYYSGSKLIHRDDIHRVNKSTGSVGLGTLPGRCTVPLCPIHLGERTRNEACRALAVWQRKLKIEWRWQHWE